MNASPDRRSLTPADLETIRTVVRKEIRTSLSDIAFGAYVVVCLLALVWPGYALLDGRIEPRMLGLPVAFAWNIGWVLLTFFVLAAYHKLHEGRGANRASRLDDPET